MHGSSAGVAADGYLSDGRAGPGQTQGGGTASSPQAAPATTDSTEIAYAEQTWWEPLLGVTTVEEAHRLAEHFVQEVRGGN